MDIKNISNIISSYRTIGHDNDNKKLNSSSVKKQKNVDKVEFSFANSIENVKAAAVKNAESSASSERIEALRNAVSDGSYSVPAEKIAAAMSFEI